jgi:hypothetical protein
MHSFGKYGAKRRQVAYFSGEQVKITTYRTCAPSDEQMLPAARYSAASRASTSSTALLKTAGKVRRSSLDRVPNGRKLCSDRHYSHGD